MSFRKLTNFENSPPLLNMETDSVIPKNTIQIYIYTFSAQRL